ncbi:hypothetical protein D3C80_631540 [compost metagenome]
MFAFPGQCVATDHRGGVADHRLQRVRRPIGSRFLNEIQQRGDHHHQCDHQCARQIFRRVRDHAKRGQQQVERVAITVPQVLPPGFFLLIVDDVLAAAFAYPFSLMGSDAFRVAVKTQIQIGDVGSGAFQPLLCQSGGQPLRFAAKAVQQAIAVHQTAR